MAFGVRRTWIQIPAWSEYNIAYLAGFLHELNYSKTAAIMSYALFFISKSPFGLPDVGFCSTLNCWVQFFTCPCMKSWPSLYFGCSSFSCPLTLGLALWLALTLECIMPARVWNVFTWFSKHSWCIFNTKRTCPPNLLFQGRWETLGSELHEGPGKLQVKELLCWAQPIPA